MELHPLSQAFVKSGQQYGLPFSADFNGGNPHGVGFYQRTTTPSGFRCSAATGYLTPKVRRRPNLTIATHRNVHKIVVKGGLATGVTARIVDTNVDIHAKQEVIVASGAFGSPRLLQLSGIGDAKHLESVGVNPIHNLPGVGENLHDHCDLDIIYELNDYGSLDRIQKVGPSMMAAGIENLAYRSGPLTSTGVEAGAFSPEIPKTLL